MDAALVIKADRIRPAARKTLFWVLHASGWLVCGLVLFVARVTRDPVAAALLRSMLFALLGFGFCLLLRAAYRRLRQRTHSVAVQWLSMLILSCGFAAVSCVLVNALAFWYQGIETTSPLWYCLWGGFLNYAFVFATWSALYLGMGSHLEIPTGNPASHSERGSRSPQDRIAVDTGQDVYLLKTEDVDYLEACGDYVQIHARGKRYLVRSTMYSLEDRLDPRRFFRIHRSTIVNVDRIISLRPHRNGEYFVVLEGGAELKLSRGYREALRDRFGKYL